MYNIQVKVFFEPKKSNVTLHMRLFSQLKKEKEKKNALLREL